jgi:hypothetical protein
MWDIFDLQLVKHKKQNYWIVMPCTFESYRIRKQRDLTSRVFQTIKGKNKGSQDEWMENFLKTEDKENFKDNGSNLVDQMAYEGFFLKESNPPKKSYENHLNNQISLISPFCDSIGSN